MNILVNGKPAAIKRDSSFEINLQSFLFTGNENFSLDIDFPMDINENREIFGTIVDFGGLESNVFDCRIMEGTLEISGYLQVLSIQNNVISTQFVEDFAPNLASNITSVYLDELILGNLVSIFGLTNFDWRRNLNRETQTIITQRGDYSLSEYGFQCLEFSSGEERFNTSDDISGQPGADTSRTPKFQIYLWKLFELLSNATGYRLVYPPISEFSKILVCNATDQGWTYDGYYREDLDISKQLPHWTLKEFIIKISNMFGCSYDINHNHRTITFSKIKGNVLPIVSIDRNVIEDDFVIETIDSAPNYKNIVGYCFPKNSDDAKYDSCSDFIRHESKRGRPKKNWETMSKFITEVKKPAEHLTEAGIYWNQFQYIRDDDLNLVKISHVDDLMFGPDQYYMTFKILNQLTVYGFQSLEELDIVPVRITKHEIYPFIFDITGKEPLGFDLEEMVCYEDQLNINEETNDKKLCERLLEYEEKNYSHSKMFIAIYDSSNSNYTNRRIPSVCPVEVANKVKHDMSVDPSKVTRYEYMSSVYRFPYSLNINAWQQLHLPSIDTSRKYTVHVITKDVLNPNAIYIVNGAKYICKNIKLDITANGISQRKELELYRIVD